MHSTAKPSIACPPMRNSKWRRFRNKARAVLSTVCVFFHIPSKEQRDAGSSYSKDIQPLGDIPNNVLNAPVKKFRESGQVRNSDQKFAIHRAQPKNAVAGANNRELRPANSSKSNSSVAFSANITEAGSTNTAASSHGKSLSDLYVQLESMEQPINILEPITSGEDPYSLYNQLDLCGEGGLCEVYKGRVKKHTPGKPRPFVALKRINLKDEVAGFLLANEINILRSVCHPNIPRFVGAYLRNDKYVTIVTDYIEGANLLEIVEFGFMNEVQIATICQELCKCLGYLHSNLIFHGDIKNANIMLTTKGVIKLIDFGSCGKLADKKSTALTLVQECAWVAPEYLRDVQCGLSSDIWALGITILAMLADLTDFFEALSSAKAYLDILSTRGAPEPDASKTSGGLRDFVSRCLRVDPHKRASAARLLKHRFLRKAADTKCLVPLVNKFFGISETYLSTVVSSRETSPIKTDTTSLKRTELEQVLETLKTITSKKDPLSIYNQLDPCGEGGFGKVYKGRAKKRALCKPRSFVALKHINLKDEDDLDFSLVNEINILRSVCHPSIPRFVGAHFPNHKKLTVVTSFVEGANLNDVLEFSKMDEVQIATVCRELCKCLDYLHSNLIFHGDIKSLNIMLTTKGEVKLLDFGTSVRLAGNSSKVYATAFSCFSAAPEVLRGDKCGLSADIWSLGMTLFEMFTQKIPYPNMRVLLDKCPDAIRKYAANRGPSESIDAADMLLDLLRIEGIPTLDASKASIAIQDFLYRCLRSRPISRATAAELLNHWFLTKATSLDCLVPLVNKCYKP